MLSFYPFLEQVCEELRRVCGGQIIIDPAIIEKDNGTLRHGVTIQNKGRDGALTVYLEAHYNDYLDGIKSVVQVAMDVLGVYREQHMDRSILSGKFWDWNFAKDHVYCNLINYAGNQDYLQNVPHERFQDLAVVFYFDTETIGAPSGMIRLRNEHLASWDISAEDLSAAAWKNTTEQMPPTLMPLGAALGQMTGEPSPDVPLLLLTNEKSFLGSVCIAYPGMTERIAEQIGDDFYVIPSSIHEVLLLPSKGNSPEELNAIVQSINESMVDPKDRLSDRVLYYDANEKKLSIPGVSEDSLNVNVNNDLQVEAPSGPRL